LAQAAPRLEELGFAVTAMSGGTLALAAAPSVLSPREAEDLIVALAGESGEIDDVEALRRRLLESLAASTACKAAVKMHHPMPPAALEALVSELFAAEHPFSCPHGRPVVLQMTDADLERRFGRR
ncbi:MAG: DNA mismatch repair protein MutL, partial [Acidobacteriota bacterium]